MSVPPGERIPALPQDRRRPGATVRAPAAGAPERICVIMEPVFPAGRPRSAGRCRPACGRLSRLSVRMSGA